MLTFVLLAAHLLAAHVAAAGTLVAALLEWRSTKSRDDVLREDARRMAWHSVWAMGLAIVLGFGLGAWKAWQGTDYRLAWQAIPSRLTWGAVELCVSLLLGILYAMAFPRDERRATAITLMHRAIAIIAATNLLYHFPSLFYAVSEIVHQRLESQLPEGELVRTVFLSAASFARMVHFAIASVFAVCIWGLIKTRSDAGTKQLTKLALLTVTLQLLSGFWLVLELPTTLQRDIMGGQPLVLALFGGGLLAAVYVMMQLVELVANRHESTLRWRVIVNSMLLMLSMIAISYLL